MGFPAWKIGHRMPLAFGTWALRGGVKPLKSRPFPKTLWGERWFSDLWRLPRGLVESQFFSTPCARPIWWRTHWPKMSWTSLLSLLALEICGHRIFWEYLGILGDTSVYLGGTKGSSLRFPTWNFVGVTLAVPRSSLGVLYISWNPLPINYGKIWDHCWGDVGDGKVVPGTMSWSLPNSWGDEYKVGKRCQGDLGTARVALEIFNFPSCKGDAFVCPICLNLQGFSRYSWGILNSNWVLYMVLTNPQICVLALLHGLLYTCKKNIYIMMIQVYRVTNNGMCFNFPTFPMQRFWVTA